MKNFKQLVSSSIYALSIYALLVLAQPVYGLSPLPSPKPTMVVTEAIKIATKFAEKEIDLKNYYIDRVWLGVPNGEKETKWIISWASDLKVNPNGGWYIVAVNYDGDAYLPKDGVPWMGKGK